MLANIKRASIYLMGFAYIAVGIIHFTHTDFFLKIMPPYLPFHLELIYLSGVIEIILGTFLMIKRYQTIAAWGIFALLIAVYPANIYLAFNETPQEAIGTTQFEAAWIRLPLQFVLLGIAYWHTKR